MSVKFQITLPEPLMAELKQESEKAGVSIAELIRQTMHDRLRKRRRTPKADPFEVIDGLVRSDETDLAARVDEILYKCGSL
jgi:metal-responsive CopG/Arc/MetJ family transcriptional regulator